MKRVLTALVLLPFFIFALWASSPYYLIAWVVAGTVLGLREFYALAERVGCRGAGRHEARLRPRQARDHCGGLSLQIGDLDELWEDLRHDLYCLGDGAGGLQRCHGAGGVDDGSEAETLANVGPALRVLGHGRRVSRGGG